MKWNRLLVLLIVGSGCCPCDRDVNVLVRHGGTLSAQSSPASILNPRTYLSPSGEYALEVDPSAMSGQGEGSYRLTQNGKAVWAAKHPFTLWEAMVTDDGTVAGYGYQYGPDGFAPGGRAEDPEPGKFHVVIIGPDGKVRLNSATKRQDTLILHDVPSPLARGMFIDSTQRRLIVRIRTADWQRGGENWWIYDLATAIRLSDVRIAEKDPALRFIEAVHPVRDTPLVLVNWWHQDDASKRNPGGAFSLIDLTDPTRPNKIWSKVLSGDYFVADTPNDQGAARRLQEEISQGGTILQCDEPRRFDVRFVAENQRVGFEVEKTKTGWQVRETSRNAYVAPASADVAPLAKVAPNHLGSLVLGKNSTAPAHPVHDIREFDIDGRGFIGFLRGERDEKSGQSCSFVLVNSEGKAIVEGVRPADDFGDEKHSSTKVAWLREDRWVVTDCEYGPQHTARAWFIDVTSGGKAQVTSIAKFNSPAVESIAATGDGGFALLTNEYKYAPSHEVLRFDDLGQRKWAISGEFANNKDLVSPQDLAVDRSHQGAIVVVQTVRNTLEFFDSGGKHARSLGLDRIFGRTVNYPTQVKIRDDGGIVLDSGGSPSIWRLAADGNVKAKFDPCFADGQQFSVHSLRLSPDNQIWLTEGDLLLRVDEKGRVDRCLGQRPDADSPGQIGSLAMGANGRIYSASTRGGIVQIFDASGKLLQVIKAAPADFASNHSLRNLAVSGDGNVYLSGSSHSYLHFKPDGSRVDWESLGLDQIDEVWEFAPNSKKRWVQGYRGAIWLVGEDGKAITKIERQPDRCWLVHPEGLAVAPDGSVAVVASDDPLRSHTSRLNLYAADGRPVRTVNLPTTGLVSSVAYNGSQAIVAGGGQVLLVNTNNSSVSLLDPEKLIGGSARGQNNAYWKALFSPDGKELWLFDLNRRSNIERYEIPPLN